MCYDNIGDYMNIYLPDMYFKSVYDINYQKLKEMGIKAILFDLDNTIRKVGDKYPEKNIKTLFDQLKKDFIIILFSNNISPKRVIFFADYYGIDYIARAGKPKQKGFNKALKFVKSKKELCIIGDQMLTDIKGGNIFGITTIFVDKFCNKEELWTIPNRIIEKLIIKRYKKLKMFEKGKYYG